MEHRGLLSGGGLFFLLVIVVFAVFAVPAGGDWPLFHHDVEHTGYTLEYSEYVGADLVLLWNYTAGGGIYSSPVIGDLDGDGIEEVVFGSDDGFVYALDYNGTVAWRYKTNGRVRSAPSIVNLSRGSFLQVLAGSEDGFVYALAHNGSLLWRFKTGGLVTSSPVILDVYNGPKPGVVFGSGDGNLYVLHSDGSEFWRYGLMAPVEQPVALADLDEDGWEDIVVSSGDKMNVVFFNNFRVIVSDSGTKVTTAPSVDDGSILVGTEDGTLCSFKRVFVGASEDVIPTVYSKEYWMNHSKVIEVLKREAVFNCSKIIYSTPTSSDLDFNKENGNEYVFGCNDGNLYILGHRENDTAFTRLWRYTTSKPVRSSPALAGLNNGSYFEIVFGSDEGYVYIVNSTGSGRWAYDIGGMVVASPAVSDVNHDGFVDLAAGSTNGVLYFFVSNTSLIIKEGRSHYDVAYRLLDMEDFENATEEGLKAREIYEGVGYSSGLKDVNNLFLDVSSREHCSRARFFYKNRLFRDAVEEIEAANYIYSSANRPFKSVCNDLLTMANALFYYSEAQALLNGGSFSRAREYAKRSNDFAVMTGDSAITVQSSLLMERVDDLEKAQNMYSEAFGDYHRGVNASDVLAKMDRAEKVYRDRNASQGLFNIVRDEANRIRVEVYLKNVTMLFNNSRYRESNDMAVRTRSMCERINNTGCLQEVEYYINRTQVYVDADGALEQAKKYYTATDFITASEYARKAKDIYTQTGNAEKIKEADDILNRSLGMVGNLERKTSLMDELSNPAVLILAIQVVVLALIVLTRPRARVVFRGFRGRGSSLGAKRVDYLGMGRFFVGRRRLRRSR